MNTLQDQISMKYSNNDTSNSAINFHDNDPFTCLKSESCYLAADDATADSAEVSKPVTGVPPKSLFSSNGMLPPKSVLKSKFHKRKGFRPSITNHGRVMHTLGRASFHSSHLEPKSRDFYNNHFHISSNESRISISERITKIPPFSSKKRINNLLRQGSQEYGIQNVNENMMNSSNYRRKNLTFSKRFLSQDSVMPKNKPHLARTKPRMYLSLPSDFTSLSHARNSEKVKKNVQIGTKVSRIYLDGAGTQQKLEKDQHQQMIKKFENVPYAFKRLNNRYVSPKIKRISQERTNIRKKPIHNRNRARQSLSVPNYSNIASLLPKQEEIGEHDVSGDHRTWSKLPPSGRCQQTRIKFHGTSVAAQQIKHSNKTSTKEDALCNELVYNYPIHKRKIPFDCRRSPKKILTNEVLQDSSCVTSSSKENPNAGQRSTIRGLTRSKSRISSHTGPFLRSSSLGACKVGNTQREHHNIYNTAAHVLKLPRGRLRIKAKSSGVIESDSHTVCCNDKKDCFAAWELTQNEILQSCMSEDLLIMRKALLQSVQYCCNQQYVLQRLKSHQSQESDDSLEESKNISQRQAQKKYSRSELKQNRLDSSNMNLLANEDNTSIQMYPAVNDESTASTEWSITSSICSNLSPKKSKRWSRSTKKAQQNGQTNKYLNNSENRTISHEKLTKTKCEHQKVPHRNYQVIRKNLSKYQIPAERHNNGAPTNTHSEQRQLKTSMGFMDTTKFQPETTRQDLSSHDLNSHLQEVSLQSHLFLPTTNSDLNRFRPIKILSNESLTVDSRNNTIHCYGSCESSLTDFLKSSSISSSYNKSLSKHKGSYSDTSKSRQSMNNLLIYYKEEIVRKVSRESRRFVVDNEQQCSTKFIRTETRKEASDAMRCANSFRKQKKTPLSVWKWRLFCFVFVLLVFTCHYIAFLAARATV